MVTQLISRRRLLQAACGSFSAVVAQSSFAQPPDPPRSAPPFAEHTLFVITRSKNANAVYYDLRLGPGGITPPSDPLDVYWRMYADKGQREELTWAERRMAYGYELLSRVEPSGFRARLTALPQRPIEIWREESGPYAAACTIDKRVAILRQVHVVATESWTGPVVQHVDLMGIDPKTREPVTERISADG